MKAPKFDNGKLSASSIKDMERYSVYNPSLINKSAIYQLAYQGVEHDIALFVGNNSVDRLFVFFSGAADRRIFTLPVFHRWSWHNQFPGHALYISDPTLKKTLNLSLGWYIGDRSFDINPGMREIFLSVANNLGISEENIIFYGSSGGGFAALRALSELPKATAIVINPQTRLSSFVGDSLSKYLSVFFPGLSVSDFSEQFSERNQITHFAEKIRYSRIIYAQCVEDDHHMSKHLTEFFHADSTCFKPKVLENCSLIFFHDQRGHAHGEPNELVPILLNKINFACSEVVYSGISA